MAWNSAPRRHESTRGFVATVFTTLPFDGMRNVCPTLSRDGTMPPFAFAIADTVVP